MGAWGFVVGRHSMAQILVQMTVLAIGTPGLQNFYSLYPFSQPDAELRWQKYDRGALLLAYQNVQGQ